jgi:phospholipase C
MHVNAEGYKSCLHLVEGNFNDTKSMDTRREFIKKATVLSGMAGMNALIPASIQRALAIDPIVGSTWKDAEHIVILMQENRSFDHSFGTLSGVRGFNDPRAIQLPDGNPVWLQSNHAGETYAPFRLDIRDTKSTWMSSLPHSWDNQVNARNDGKYDQWLNVKRNSIKEYSNMPLTLGYYNREDIPFYYELADGFTICDQHFCSALTGTNPNRLYFWTGTIRAEQNENSRANVWNEDMDYETLSWKTFPEVLEENDISWKFYQNELSIDVGFKDEEDPWLSNFQDNPLEFFSQYNIRLHNKHLIQVRNLLSSLPTEISSLQNQLDNLQPSDPSVKKIQKTLGEKKKALDEAMKEIKEYNQEKYESLSSKDKSLHQKAFVTNINDPHYHSLEELSFEDNGTKRNLKIPKGDLLHQFREDVNTGKLPTVSWLAAPENLSDHPASAWYGAWYVSEVMDILTKNPEVWKKTIFILTYDENDGYFDHVPPFVAPDSGNPETGKASDGLDTSVEIITVQQAKERKGHTSLFQRESPIGLGFRVPLIVASPWSRGGYVNSEIFDLTSTIQFLETFLTQKTGKSIKDSNMSEWRRTVCGDLTSIFRASTNDQQAGLEFLKKDAFMESVYNAKFKKLPNGFKALGSEEISQFQKDPYTSELMPKQEKGIKPSNGLSYQLYADGILNLEKDAFEVRFESSSKTFGKSALGSAFNVYAPGKYLQAGSGSLEFKKVRTWAFAVKSSTKVEAIWPLKNFENGIYHLRIYGPNGFFREFKGSADDPLLLIGCEYETASGNKLSGNIELILNNQSKIPIRIEITDNAYKNTPVKKVLHPAINNSGNMSVPINLGKQFGWYDFTVRIAGNELFEKRFAGRVDTGEQGYSDPYMGRTI